MKSRLKWVVFVLDTRLLLWEIGNWFDGNGNLLAIIQNRLCRGCVNGREVALMK